MNLLHLAGFYPAAILPLIIVLTITSVETVSQKSGHQELTVRCSSDHMTFLVLQRRRARAVRVLVSVAVYAQQLMTHVVLRGVAAGGRR
jgi:hypothetical protein